MILCNLSDLIKKRNLTITQLSRHARVSRPTLTALVSNASTGIQYDTIEKLCNYLNVTPNDLISYIPYNFYFDVEMDESVDGQVEIEVWLYKKGWLQFKSKIVLDLKGYLTSREIENIELNAPQDIDNTNYYVDLNICAAWDYEVFPIEDMKFTKEYKNFDLTEAQTNAKTLVQVYKDIPQIFKNKIEKDVQERIRSFLPEGEELNFVYSFTGSIIPTD